MKGFNRVCWVLLGIIVPSGFGLAGEIDPIVKPGYVPGAEAKRDERGIWMEMNDAEKELKRSPLLVRDHLINDYIREIGCKVAGAYCDDIRIYVLRNPHFNASMAPNGVMILHTGLLVRAPSTDHVAAVIGHEIAHYTQAHTIKRFRAAKNRLTMSMLVSMGLAIGGIDSAGLPEMFAITTVMGFTRNQESEADLLGAQLMNAAGYNPAAAADNWTLLAQEEEAASVKRPKGPLFLSSHPAPEKRSTQLQALNTSLLRKSGEDPVKEGDPHIDLLGAYYGLFMGEQIKQGDFGRISVLLNQHEVIGINPADIEFYRGEARRVRGGAGDHELAMQHYQTSIAASNPNAGAYRELGYLEYKHGEKESARKHFKRYLALVPDAPDVEMIEFYLEGDW